MKKEISKVNAKLKIMPMEVVMKDNWCKIKEMVN